MKYKTELKMCRDVTMLISAMITPTKHKYLPEVPRSSGNNHSDMLFIKNNGLMFVIEYKLSGVKNLIRQVQNYGYKIGIINQTFDKKELLKDRYLDHGKIFPYTGIDEQLEKIGEFIESRNPFGSQRYDAKELMIYWWAYLHSESSLEGGIQNGKRESFFQIYKRAIRNLQEHYRFNLDFDVVYSVLGFYCEATARKHYNDIMDEIAQKRLTQSRSEPKFDLPEVKTYEQETLAI